MKKEKLSFESDLWGQCNKLHDRINKKKSYLLNLAKSLEPICDIIKDLQKKLESVKISPDPTISKFLYTQNEETGNSNAPLLYGIPLTISKYICSLKNLIDFYNQTFFHITKGLEDLIKKINTEKDEYNNFVKCMKTFGDSKLIMEKNMKIYQQKMIAAERSVLDLKRVEVIQLSINNDTANLENKKLMEEKATQLTNDSVKPFKIYFESLRKTNDIREESIEKQKNLLYKYQYLEEEVGKTNISIANILLQIEKIIKETTEQDISDFQNLIHNIKVNKDIRQLILDYKGNEKPEEEILFNYFPSVVNFSECDDNKSFEIFQKTIEFIKDIVGQEYPNYDRQLEIEKNDLRELLYKLFNKFEKEKSVKIMEYLTNENLHYYCLILLSKLRSNNKYQQSKIMIDFLGKLLNFILDASEKKKNYNNAKNCIILSQTFYYEENEEKIYLLEKVKNHKWLKSQDFWLNFAFLSIGPELQKLVNDSSGLTMEDILNHNDEKISSNLKRKISDIIFSQLLPFVNNIKDFEIDLKIIVEITEDFLNKYDYLDEDEKSNVFSLISDNQEEINRIREECKNKTQLKENEEKIENDEIPQKKENNIRVNNKINSINANNINNKTKEKENKFKEKENKPKEKEKKLKEKENKLKENENKSKEPENKYNEKENKNNEKEDKIDEKENIQKEKETKTKEKEGKSKGFLSIFKKKDKEKEKKKEKEKEKDDIEEELRQRNTTMPLAMSKTMPKEIKKEQGLFKNVKNKILNKDKKSKENKDIDEEKEEEKEEIKEEIKEEAKDIDSKIPNKIQQGKKMFKIDFTENKLQPLKPVPKAADNSNNNNEKTNNAGNPFGVVLKKIDKGKKYI